MKWIAAILVLGVVVFLIGCNADAPKKVTLQTEYITLPIESNSDKNTETSTPENPLLWSTTVTFDENNTINFYVSEEEQDKLYVMCSFDGENPSVEYTRVLSAIAVASKYGFSQKLFMVIISGENTGMVQYGNNYKMEFPKTYTTPDDSVSADAINSIESALSEFMEQ